MRRRCAPDDGVAHEVDVSVARVKQFVQRLAAAIAAPVRVVEGGGTAGRGRAQL